MRAHKLKIDSLRVDSFEVTHAGGVASEPWKRSISPPSCLPMCTDVSCTAGFPDCDFSVDPALCPVVATSDVKTA